MTPVGKIGKSTYNKVYENSQKNLECSIELMIDLFFYIRLQKNTANAVQLVIRFWLHFLLPFMVLR
ncbi:hypothetical protein BKP37_17640 [Anaerobacillus alkalilacustris]|uniref:Uncharacterized protein n=1 Tax=Anaerobacillus alkalilacustris TaxID=393763 RepID=A0A1S2LDP2_9BACI|nr:hypothetical protein BKP37_17640 [Anaerobacillus alkalilacustris]